MTTKTPTKGPMLKDLYQKIYNISASLLNDFTDEGMIATAQMRSDLFREIEKEEKELKKEFHASTILDEDTRIVMAKVVKIDAVITKKTQDRMNQMRIELKGLYSKSRATIAYTAYKRP
jgi:hypothetical protein